MGNTSGDPKCFDTEALTNVKGGEFIIQQVCVKTFDRKKDKWPNNYVAMELADGDYHTIRNHFESDIGSLGTFADSTTESSIIVSIKCMINVCKALIVLKKNRKVYPDMKPANILYVRKPISLHKYEFFAKLGDLDGACEDGVGSRGEIFPDNQSSTYPPPELWGLDEAIQFASIPCDGEVNSWSVGILLIGFLETELLRGMAWDKVGNPDYLRFERVLILDECQTALASSLLLMNKNDLTKLLEIFTIEKRPTLQELLDIFVRYHTVLKTEFMNYLVEHR